MSSLESRIGKRVTQRIGFSTAGDRQVPGLGVAPAGYFLRRAQDRVDHIARNGLFAKCATGMALGHQGIKVRECHCHLEPRQQVSARMDGCAFRIK